MVFSGLGGGFSRRGLFGARVLLWLFAFGDRRGGEFVCLIFTFVFAMPSSRRRIVGFLWFGAFVALYGGSVGFLVVCFLLIPRHNFAGLECREWFLNWLDSVCEGSDTGDGDGNYIVGLECKVLVGHNPGSRQEHGAVRKGLATAEVVDEFCKGSFDLTDGRIARKDCLFVSLDVDADFPFASGGFGWA